MMILFWLSSKSTRYCHRSHQYPIATATFALILSCSATKACLGRPLSLFVVAAAASAAPHRHQHQKPFLTCFQFWKQQKKHSLLKISTTTTAMAKLESPSAERNKDPIWNVLETKIFLPESTKVTTIDINNNNDNDDAIFHILEIAGGAGVHLDYCCMKLLQQSKFKLSFKWYPTDPSIDAMKSQQAYSEPYQNNVHTPMQLTLNENGIIEQETQKYLVDSSTRTFDLIININMIHISPWEATIGLMKVAGQLLTPETGILYLYGPYRVGGTCVESNLKFEQWLKSKDPGYGVRNLEDVLTLANENGLELVETIEMPANNLSILLRRCKT